LLAGELGTWTRVDHGGGARVFLVCDLVQKRLLSGTLNLCVGVKLSFRGFHVPNQLADAINR
jgi:hypothetical protein